MQPQSFPAVSTQSCSLSQMSLPSKSMQYPVTVMLSKPISPPVPVCASNLTMSTSPVMLVTERVPSKSPSVSVNCAVAALAVDVAQRALQAREAETTQIQKYCQRKRRPKGTLPVSRYFTRQQGPRQGLVFRAGQRSGQRRTSQ